MYSCLQAACGASSNEGSKAQATAAASPSPTRSQYAAPAQRWPQTSGITQTRLKAAICSSSDSMSGFSLLRSIVASEPGTSQHNKGQELIFK